MPNDAPPTEATRIDDSGWHWRSYPWIPADTSKAPLAERSGLEYFTALKNGTLPPQPITQTVGWQIETVEHGLLRLSLKPGGMSTLQAGQGCTTLQLNVHNIRGVRPDGGILIAEGRVRHAGRTSATAEGNLFDSAGRLHAHATTTCLIFPARPGV
jgi:uncharacterized protein (TIGR00369 family)